MPLANLAMVLAVAGALRHPYAHVAASALQTAQDFDRLVRGYPARHAERDAPALELAAALALRFFRFKGRHKES